MKRHLLLSCLAAFSLSTLAQSVSDGFYRVQNYGTKRYTYVYDNTGKINVQATSADMGAIALYRTPERRLTDPASVIYISKKGTSGKYDLYDLETQGTGVYKIINYYVNVYGSHIQGAYYVYETQYGQYLYDSSNSPYYDKTSVATSTNVKYRDNMCWNVIPVSASSDEYLGIGPDAAMKVGAKYYKPYYLGFAMDFASSGMKAYYVSDVKSDAVIIKEVVGTIPAATPIIVECSSPNATDNRVTPKYQSPASIIGNKLTGNYFCYADHGPTAYKEYDAATMRLLSVKDGRLCYVTDPDNKLCTELEFRYGDESEFRYCIPANSSYLQVPAGTAAELPVMTEAEYDALHPTTKKGDVNGDGSINSTDALVLNRIIASGKTAAQQPQADINGDGQINSTDALVLNRFIASGQ